MKNTEGKIISKNNEILNNKNKSNKNNKTTNYHKTDFLYYLPKLPFLEYTTSLIIFLLNLFFPGTGLISLGFKSTPPSKWIWISFGLFINIYNITGIESSSFDSFIFLFNFFIFVLLILQKLQTKLYNLRMKTLLALLFASIASCWKIYLRHSSKEPIDLYLAPGDNVDVILNG